MSTRALKSIVVSGGYEDDGDYGNAGLMKSRVEGLPVRVVRGAYPRSAFAPETNAVPAEPSHQDVLSWGPSSSERVSMWSGAITFRLPPPRRLALRCRLIPAQP